MIRFKYFPTNYEFFIAYALILSILSLEVYLTHYIKPLPSFFSFSSSPMITNEGKFLEFTLWRNISNLKFKQKSNGASVDIEINRFCKGKHCKIPLVVGGNSKLTINTQSYMLFSKHFTLPNLSFSCIGEDWDTRLCQAKNTCKKDLKLYIKSPYDINFDNTLLSIGFKAPPIDVAIHKFKEKFRVTNEEFGDSVFIPKRTFLFGPDILDSTLYTDIFSNILPLYLSITKYFEFSRKYQISVFEERFKFPLLINLLFDKQIQPLKEYECYEQLIMGGEKFIFGDDNLIFNYKILPNQTIPFRSEILQALDLNYTEKPYIILHNDNSLKNEEKIKQILEKHYPNHEIRKVNLASTNKVKQIKLLANADAFIGPISKSLGNAIWMKPGSTFIELNPYNCTCVDSYESIAKGAGLKYIKYIASFESEKPKTESKILEKCWGNKDECKSLMCYTNLIEQEVSIDPDNFEKFLSDRLK